jgi:transposase
MTLSEDLRKRVVLFVQNGGSKTKACRLFGVSRSSIYNWLAAESLVVKKTRNVTPRKLDPQKLQAHVADFPDAYQYERAEALGVSEYVVWYGLKRLGIKKNAAVQRERRQLSQ